MGRVPTRSTRRPRISVDDYVDVADRLDDLLVRGWQPSQIHRQLVEEFGEARVPVVRTVQNHARKIRPPDPSGTWSARDDPAEEAAVVLPVLWAVIVESEGRLREITNLQAQEIKRVLVLAPRLSLWRTFVLAAAYANAVLRGEDTMGLDLFVGFAPWESREHTIRYIVANLEEWVPDIPHRLYDLCVRGGDAINPP